MTAGHTQRTYFAFFPHAQLVRGARGAAIHDLLRSQVLWLRDSRVADGVARVAAGTSTAEAAAESGLAGADLDRYLAALAALDLTTVVATPTAHHRYRPVLSAAQAREKGLFRNHGTLTIELANECVYDCPWCTSRNPLTALACHCGVWPAQGTRLSPAERDEIVARFAEQGVSTIVVRGGEPLLYWDELAALLHTASTLHLHCEVHSTGLPLTGVMVSAFREHGVRLVLLCAALDAAAFDGLVGRKGAALEFQRAVEMLRAAQVPFAVKVPARIGGTDTSGVLVNWAVSAGAQRVERLPYATPADEGATIAIRLATAAATPQDMAVDAHEFYTNMECHSCFANAVSLSVDGKLKLCLGASSAVADLRREPITKVLREARLDAARTGTGRSDAPGCRICEFRYGCRACFVRSAEVADSTDGRHWNCRFDPETGEWAGAPAPG